MRLQLRIVFPVLLYILIPLAGITQGSYTVTGRVVDIDSRQALKNVSVVNRLSKTGTVTDDSGYYNLHMRTSHGTIAFSYIGYVTALREVDLLENGDPINIQLKRRANDELDEVVVNAGIETSKVKTVEMGVVKINAESIKKTPLLMGEADIIKALILQPGVTSVGEGAGGFNVRGGNADQNLVLVDGAPLFNTSHLLGFYTSVTPDALQDVTLYKGGIPAMYGGRLSSLLNMKVKNGSNTDMQYTGGVGPMSARFFMNGPLVKNKLTFAGGFRMAYPDLILNQLNGSIGNSRAFFYDGILKAEYTFNDKNKLSVTGYRSYDRFRFDSSTAYDWASNLVSVNYVSEFNSRLTFKLNANYSQFVSDINGLDTGYEFKVRSSISQKQFKPVFTFTPNNKHTIEAGADVVLYDISPGSRVPTSTAGNINPLTIQDEHGREMALFVSDQITFSDKISLQLGLRYAMYDYLGPKTIYTYQAGVPMAKETITDSSVVPKNKSIQHYGGLEPRIALKIGLNENLTLKLSYNRAQQFLHLISNTTSISPVDFWKLSDQFSNRQISDQYSTGLFTNFHHSQYDASVEVYYKSTSNIPQYKDGALLLLNPYIESALLNARGRAYGAEFSLTKNTGNFTWQVNYTYSKSEVQVLNTYPSEIINGGNYYPSDIDRPHNISMMGKVKLGRGWSFSTNFVYASGRPATYPDGNYVFNGAIVNNYSQRNMDRLPAYHRLDAGFTCVSKRYPEQKRFSTWNISFYNIYMRQNAYSIYFKRDNTQLFSYRLSVIGSLVPSLSWNYNF